MDGVLLLVTFLSHFGPNINGRFCSSTQSHSQTLF